MTTWRDKVILITGGSSGLGFAIARQFARKEAIVCLLARNSDRLEQAKKELASEQLPVHIYSGDVLDDQDAITTIEQIVADHGRLDALVNNVGKSCRRSILESSIADFDELMKLNFYSAVRYTQAALTELTKSKGHIVNVGSLASRTAWPFMGPYSASKHALAAYTDQLRIEGPKEVHVMHVCPGPIRRDGQNTRYDDQVENLPAGARQPGGGAKLSLLCPDKLARKIIFGCERRKSEIIVPAKAKFLFALARISIRLGDWVIRKKFRG